MEWVKFPLILKSTKTGKLYLRLSLSKKSKFTTEWTCDDVAVMKSLIEENLLSSEKSHGDMPEVINVALENITDIH